ncbi:MAG: hypothetical protein JWQ98_1770 [Chlorobi bacterium]|nr:hypothetical protein [Chlorobiota bacterium]
MSDSMLHSILQDIRFGARMLVRKPGVTIVAVLALALGIGANTTIFSAVNAILFRPLPVRNQEGLVVIRKTEPDGTDPLPFSHPEYLDYRDGSVAFSGIAAWTGASTSLMADGEPEVVSAEITSGNYFSTLGISPAIGRFFGPTEDQVPGRDPVTVISYPLWQHRFGGDPGIVGRRIELNGAPFTVIGVAAREFTGLTVGEAPALWVPMMMYHQIAPGQNDIIGARNVSGLMLFGRLKDGISPERAIAEMNGIASGIGKKHPDNARGEGIALAPLDGLSSLSPGERENVRSFVAIMMAVAGLVLMIACINVAGMLLARSAARRHEMAIRLAIGAGRRRLVRQLLTETTLLFLLGGGVAMLMAVWSTDLLRSFHPPPEVPIAIDPAIDLRVLGFTFAISLITGLLFGLTPALRGSKTDLADALKEAPSGDSHRSRLRGIFVTAQVALSLILLIGAGLFLRTLQHAASIDPGFDPDHVELAVFDLSLHGYDEARGAALYGTLLERLRATPGVNSAALASIVPLGFSNAMMMLTVEGSTPRVGEDGFLTNFNIVTPGHFATMRMPLVKGRDFSAEDRQGHPQVAIVNETFARTYWPGGNPIGRRISMQGKEGPFMEVVGVAKDGKYKSLGEASLPYLYLPFGQNYTPSMTLQVRTSGDEAAALTAIRGQVHKLDPNIPLLNPMPLSRYIASALLPQRIAAWVAGTFGVLGLLLTAVGIYGMVSYAVIQRTREIGIRMALGAGRNAVMGMMMRQGFVPVALGVALGLIGAFASAPLLASFVFGISTFDPLTYLLVALALMLVALVACYIPARRASNVDPIAALKYE